MSTGTIVMTDSMLADSCGAGLEVCSKEVIHAWPWKTWSQAHEKEVIGHRVNILLLMLSGQGVKLPSKHVGLYT